MRSRRCILVLGMLVIASTAAPAPAQVMATPHLDFNVAGDVETTRGGVGVSVGYYFRGLVGVELDLERYSHFFKDADVAGLVPDGVDLNTDAILAMGNVVVPYRIRGAAAGIWCPYAVAGLGLIQSVFDAAGGLGPDTGQDYDTDQTNLAFNVGGGVMHALTDLVGLRVDVRYVRALVDEDAGTGGYFKDYDFWRVSVGVTVGLPRLIGIR